MNLYEPGLAGVGVVVLLAALLPTYLHRQPLSLPMVLVALGGVAALVVPSLRDIDPRAHLPVTERLTELGVLVSLLGAGLAIDRVPGWRRWASTWRLLLIAMPLTIAAVAVSAWWLLGAPLSMALLLGAVLAPTDPVLAADVQVGEPTVAEPGTPAGPIGEAEVQIEEEDEVRFALTSEAGLNDGLAFPFVYAAIAAAGAGSLGQWAPQWIAIDLLGRLLLGTAVGWCAGVAIGRVVFAPPKPFTPLADTTEGFVAVGAILLTYGLTEMIHGYGFIAVFVAAVTLRSRQRVHPYHRTLHQFSGQLEQLLSVGLLVLLGAAVAGGLLGELSWGGVAVAGLLVFVIRPLAGRVALARGVTTVAERRAIGFFGIRGIGSLYYLAYAERSSAWPASLDGLWATTVFAVVLSIVVHGVSATPAMRRLDRRRRRTRRRVRPEAQASGGRSARPVGSSVAESATHSRVSRCARGDNRA